jgi:biopolymer transport protein ExbB/TolQ
MNTIEVVKHLLLRFGASWVLWLLAGLSVTSIVLIVERWLFYRTAHADLQRMAERLHELLSARRIDQAIAELSGSPAIAASIALAGLRLADHGSAAADKAMQSATALERSRLEKRLAFLGTLGNNAPFVGLFGTVIGVIAAFEELGHGAPGHGTGVSAAGQVASQAVMSSIAEALVATAVGLLVALPAVAAYNYLQRRVTSLIAETEVLSNLVLAYLVDRDLPAPEPRGVPAPQAV